jgi:hypothetical protein
MYTMGRMTCPSLVGRPPRTYLVVINAMNSVAILSSPLHGTQGGEDYGNRTKHRKDQTSVSLIDFLFPQVERLRGTPNTTPVSRYALMSNSVVGLTLTQGLKSN